MQMKVEKKDHKQKKRPGPVNTGCCALARLPGRSHWAAVNFLLRFFFQEKKWKTPNENEKIAKSAYHL
jgi:hypothetical protein